MHAYVALVRLSGDEPPLTPAPHLLGHVGDWRRDRETVLVAAAAHTATFPLNCSSSLATHRCLPLRSGMDAVGCASRVDASRVTARGGGDMARRPRCWNGVGNAPARGVRRYTKPVGRARRRRRAWDRCLRSHGYRGWGLCVSKSDRRASSHTCRLQLLVQVSSLDGAKERWASAQFRPQPQALSLLRGRD